MDERAKIAPKMFHSFVERKTLCNLGSITGATPKYDNAFSSPFNVTFLPQKKKRDEINDYIKAILRTFS